MQLPGAPGSDQSDIYTSPRQHIEYFKAEHIVLSLRINPTLSRNSWVSNNFKIEALTQAFIHLLWVKSFSERSYDSIAHAPTHTAR